MASVHSNFPKKNLITSVLKISLAGNGINCIVSDISRISQMGSGNHKGGGTNLLFGQNFSKTAWKWKKFDQDRGVPVKCFVVVCIP